MNAMPILPKPEEMYRALEQKDPAFDGIFFVAVRTTGIFCRPVCPARKPKPENVEYFGSARDALHAGYRPCKRCHPLDGGADTPDWVRMLLEKVDAAPMRRLTDQDIRAEGLEPTRARRWFKDRYGMTFQAYHRARRMGLALREVRNGQDLTEAAFDVDYESPSAFREAFAKVFGAPPGRAREAAKCLLVRWIDTPLGAMLAAADDEGLHLLEFVDRRMLRAQIETLQRRTGAKLVPGDHSILRQTELELAEYFDGRRNDFSIPLVLKGSEFQEAAWRALLTIPYGTTASYAEQARRLGKPDAQRAVGKANGDNRLAIVVPCHRVVRSDGTLCGYGGGLWRKRWLLNLEQSERGSNSQP